MVLGAWWQGRSSIRLLRIQAEEAERVRRTQAEEAERVRQSQSQHEQLMKLFDDKRASYVHLLTVAANLAQARLELWEDVRLPFDHQALDSDQNPEQREKQASDEVDAALSMIEILAPRAVYESAVQLCGAALEVRSTIIHIDTSDFIGCVRRDLGTDPTPPGLTPRQ
ncbi:hypothetical protein [Micromonospora avicenniae]|uniref:hypothetical protein n=1 Tax=Micromonospora avicenniae TaxID=1198245 RepID=UPI003418B8C6